MLLSTRFRLALPLALLSPLTPIATPAIQLTPPPPHAKSVLWFRHGQSEANARGVLGSAVLDAQLTDLGRRQTASWSSVAPSLGVERIFCSPLVRSIESATSIFAEADPNLCLTVTPAAREYHWEQAENRGRLAAGLLSGTRNGRPGERVAWPVVDSFDRRIERIGELERPSRIWDPIDEASLTAQAAQERWQRGLRTLAREITTADASRLAVVCHYGVIEALCGVAPANAAMIETSVWVDDEGETQIQLQAPVQVPPLVSRASGVQRLLLLSS